MIRPSKANGIPACTDTNLVTGTEIHCSTPVEIVEIWKIGDFFGIPELVREAQQAMYRRLNASAEFLACKLEVEWPSWGPNGCEFLRDYYERCGHNAIERRTCAVRNVQPDTVFHLYDPNDWNRRVGFCHECHDSLGLPGDWPHKKPYIWGYRADVAISNRSILCISHQDLLFGCLNKEARVSIEDEIRALCEALVLATNETPLGSGIQKSLIDHLCKTRVNAWLGFTACRLLGHENQEQFL